MEQKFIELTPHLLNIISLYARNFTYAQIADELGISPDTVATHMKKVTGALNLPMHSIIYALAKAGVI